MRVLAAGDNFVGPDLLETAVRSQVDAPEVGRLKLPWPVEPFGPVGGVEEASGTEQQVIEAAEGAEVCVTQMAPFTERVFDAVPSLQLVAVSRGGPVNVDLAAATRAGVSVTYAPGRNAAAAAEYAVGMILAAMRRIPDSDSELKRGEWRGDFYAYPEAGIELEGSTVGLVGYGAIGSRVARVLRAFGAEVLVADPYTDPDKLRADGVEPVGLEEMLPRCSVVSLHARLTPETKHLLDADRLALLPEGAVLVNTARGGLLDYRPLSGLLRDGKLGALALDVYDEEPPPPDWPLHGAPNLITTPHLAGATRQTAHRAAEIVAAEVGRYARGEPAAHLANPDVLGSET
ncbi:D-3-phosphoglycerate dehydrogenase [Actinopolyspora xinjiangensis]|uniref:D-3-phosphoglycerate dehydrogenase n=1 Tax=Actinopolyspora xinjiangensis TaxID=405564 RepID=A0A1H0X0L0_9ACTN|nr:2-hydroxyacid dehydrogenase [Actinopolyspora xinjiangensis]SDP95996.1 D-3-phosphoglycerate dehydrogenase [Actinopolyspora xinjiangensis]